MHRDFFLLLAARRIVRATDDTKRRLRAFEAETSRSKSWEIAETIDHLELKLDDLTLELHAVCQELRESGNVLIVDADGTCSIKGVG